MDTMSFEEFKEWLKIFNDAAPLIFTTEPSQSLKLVVNNSESSAVQDYDQREIRRETNR